MVQRDGRKAAGAGRSDAEGTFIGRLKDKTLREMHTVCSQPPRLLKTSQSIQMSTFLFAVVSLDELRAPETVYTSMA